MAGRRELVIPKAPFIVPYRLQRKCHSFTSVGRAKKHFSDATGISA